MAGTGLWYGGGVHWCNLLQFVLDALKPLL
jgi:hypothetical protein